MVRTYGHGAAGGGDGGGVGRQMNGGGGGGGGGGGDGGVWRGSMPVPVRCVPLDFSPVGH
jgi:hypothetical protein